MLFKSQLICELTEQDRKFSTRWLCVLKKCRQKWRVPQKADMAFDKHSCRCVVFAKQAFAFMYGKAFTTDEYYWYVSTLISF